MLHGLAAVNEFRGRYHRSEALLTEVLLLGDEDMAVHAHELLACSTFHQGRGRPVGPLRRADPRPLRPGPRRRLPGPYGEHPAVSCHDWAALSLWFLGRSDSALAHATQAHELATVHPYSLASAQGSWPTCTSTGASRPRRCAGPACARLPPTSMAS